MRKIEKKAVQGFRPSSCNVETAFLTSLSPYPAVHHSLDGFKLFLLQLRYIFTQNFQQIVRVRLQLLVLLVADVDSGLPPGARGRRFDVVVLLVVRGRALLDLLSLDGAFLSVPRIHPVVGGGEKV